MASKNTRFTCSLDGYKKATEEAFNAVLTPLNMAFKLIPVLTGYLSNLLGARSIRDLVQSLNYIYEYATLTLPGSLGYMVGATFYFTKYLGYGSYLCDASGYLYYVIYYADYLNVLLGQLADQGGETTTSS